MFYWAFVLVLFQSRAVVGREVDVISSNDATSVANYIKGRNASFFNGIKTHNRDAQECFLKYGDVYMARHSKMDANTILASNQEELNGCSCGCSGSEVWDSFSKRCVAIPADLAEVPIQYTPKDAGEQVGFKRDDEEHETHKIPKKRIDTFNLGTCGANCEQCSRVVDPGDKFSETTKHTKWCKSCHTGYGLETDGTERTCAKCDISNCGNCDGDKDECNSCKDGYYGEDEDGDPAAVTKIKKCQKCPASLGAVTKCRVTNADTDKSSNAKPYVVAEECEGDELSMFEDKDVVFDRHYLRSMAESFPHGTKASGGKCLKMGKEDECETGCRYCNHADDNRGNAWCRQCEPGYQLWDGRCLACPPNCNSCDGERNCLHCKSGYFVGTDGKRSSNKVCIKCQEDASGAPPCFSGSLAFALLSIIGIFGI